MKNLTNDIIIHRNINGTEFVGFSQYNLGYDDPKYAAYIYDDGTDSFIKREIDIWYNNTLGSNSEYDKNVISGRFCSDSSGYKHASEYGYSEKDYNVFASYDRLVQEAREFSKDNSPTFICPETSESYGGSYRLKAGLITADEMVFAGESFNARSNSYLTAERYNSYWGMTPAAFDNEYYSWNNVYGLSTDKRDHSLFLRPVINISTDNMILTGDGTEDNPC